MAHQVENMVSLRKMPWHGLGTVVSQEMTMGEALHLSGMDYSMNKVPLYGPNGEPVEGTYGIQRDDTGRILGTCKDRYKIIQNVEAFDFMNDLKAEGDVTWETAGVLDEGRTVWILARMGRTRKIAGDEVEPYVLFHNRAANNGSAGVKNSFTRVVCANTLALSFREQATKESSLSIPHVGDIKRRLWAARDALGIIQAEQEKMVSFGEAAAKIALTDSMVEEFMASIMPIPEAPEGVDEEAAKTYERKQTRRDNKVSAISALLESETNKTPATNGTLWGLFNAATEWADHESQRRGSTTTADHVWFGNAGKHKALMLDAAIALI